MDDLRDAGQSLQPRRIHAAVIADETDGSALRAGHWTRFVSHFLNDADDAIDVFRRRVVLHDN